jgi:hypothetical protein
MTIRQPIPAKDAHDAAVGQPPLLEASKVAES